MYRKRNTRTLSVMNWPQSPDHPDREQNKNQPTFKEELCVLQFWRTIPEDY